MTTNWNKAISPTYAVKMLEGISIDPALSHDPAEARNVAYAILLAALRGAGPATATVADAWELAAKRGRWFTPQAADQVIGRHELKLVEALRRALEFIEETDPSSAMLDVCDDIRKAIAEAGEPSKCPPQAPPSSPAPAAP